MENEALSQILQALIANVLFQAGDADGSGHVGVVVENAGSDADRAFGIFLVVDCIAAPDDAIQIRVEGIVRRQGVGRAPGQPGLGHDGMGFGARHGRQHGLAHGGTVRKFAAPQRRLEPYGTRRIDAADDHRIAVVQNGDTAGQVNFLGQFTQDRQRDIGQLYARDGHITETRQRHAQTIASRHSIPDIADKTMCDEGLQNGVTGGFRHAQFRRKIGQAGAVAAVTGNQFEQIEGTAQALYTISLVHRCMYPGGAWPLGPFSLTPARTIPYDYRNAEQCLVIPNNNGVRKCGARGRDMAKWPRKLRSGEWFGGEGKNAFMHRSWMKNQGMPADVFDGRPVIGICNTFSELTPCNAHLRTIAEHVKRGVLEAGGLPLEFPVMSLGESNLRPTAMMFRNLASMDVEESIRGNPMDGVILLVGCDKTTPALLMGAASCDLPTIAVSGGPMLNGNFRGAPVGSGTHVWKVYEDLKAGRISVSDFLAAEQGQSRSAGSCMTMGTASTMASMVEALGIGLTDNAAIPAVDARRHVLAQLSGRRIVELVKQDIRMSRILTRAAFENAIRANAAIGGSTNALIHLIAVAGRIGVDLSIDDWDRLGRDVPTIVDLMPSGRFLMEEFYYAGGLKAVLRILAENKLLHLDTLNVSGQTTGEIVEDAPNYNSEVIRGFDNPLTRQGGIAVLRGNLAPRGAVIKPSAATPALMQHRGRAVVFENIEHYHARVDDHALDIDETCVMVLKNCGPKGYPGMAEVGNMSLPAKLLKKGVTDMVRISDARMSGTAYGTVVLHTAPEAAIGGPLALVRDGDMIELDVAGRRLHLDVSENELARRREEWTPPADTDTDGPGGYRVLFTEHVLQADQGCDFDFLLGKRGARVPRHSH